MNTLTTTPTHKTKLKKATVIKNITLDGVKALRAEKITTTYEIKREINPKNLHYYLFSKNKVNEVVEPLIFPLTEVTPKELLKYRNSNTPSFVLKKDSKLYYATIPRNLNLCSASIFEVHQCGNECCHVSALPDEQGGCAKIRDRYPRIENYDFIKRGYQTFNTSHDAFVVAICFHYEKCTPRPKLSTEELNQARLGLAQFAWADLIKSREQVKRYCKKKQCFYKSRK